MAAGGRCDARPTGARVGVLDGVAARHREPVLEGARPAAPGLCGEVTVDGHNVVRALHSALEGFFFRVFFLFSLFFCHPGLLLAPVARQ